MATFDATWVANRFRYRKRLTGTRLRLDDVTGYLEPSDRRGFSAEMRKTVVERFRVCSNMAAICRSVNIDIQAFYDAIAVDPKFRNDIIACKSNPDRSKRLNDEMIKLASSEKVQVLTELSKRIGFYK